MPYFRLWHCQGKPSIPLHLGDRMLHYTQEKKFKKIPRSRVGLSLAAFTAMEFCSSFSSLQGRGLTVIFYFSMEKNDRHIRGGGMKMKIFFIKKQLLPNCITRPQELMSLDGRNLGYNLVVKFGNVLTSTQFLVVFDKSSHQIIPSLIISIRKKKKKTL